MGLFILVLIAIACLFVCICISATALLLVGRMFRIENINFKNSFFIVLTSFAITSVVNIPLSFSYGGTLLIFTPFFVFYYLMLRYHKVRWLKSFFIYIVYVFLSLIFILLIFLPIRTYLLSPYVVVGTSMMPTLSNGQYLFANNINKNFKRGDIIVFTVPGSLPARIGISRVISMPGEQLQITKEGVSINGQILDENSYQYGDSYRDREGGDSVTLSSDQYYVMGDNRTIASDSRVWGPVPKENIIGIIFFTVPSQIISR